MNIIDQVLDRYERKEPNFTVTLPKGEVLTFRHFKNSDDFEQFVTSAADFAKLVDKPPAGPMKEVMPKSRGVAINAFMVSYLAVEPKINQLQALKLTQRPEIFFHIVNAIESAKYIYEAKQVEEGIERGKESSKATQSEEPS